MTAPCRRGFLAGSLGLALTACVELAPAQSPEGVVRTDPSPRFAAFVGPKTQHTAPFLGVPDTNFFCLRSLVDRHTGATTHQLYVSDSYSGAEHGWKAAHDGNGARLRFIAISRDDIPCPEGACFVEDFAADLPETALRGNPAGFVVNFSAKSGEKKTIAISADRIAAQLAAIEAWRQTAQR
jgi:hypothetical protein